MSDRGRRGSGRTSGGRTPGSRAQLVVLAVVGLLVSVVVGAALAGSAAAHDHEGYVVEQGDQCVPVEPVSQGTDTASEFYNYGARGTDFSSRSTREYQENDASVLILYEGPEGLSLVIIHDQWHSNRSDGTRGGTASFEVTGLPHDGEWTVEDDDYHLQSDEFEHGDTESELHWVWNDGRTDGAVFTGLGSSFAVEIDPRFNDDADLEPSNDHEDGEISDWQVITASADGEGFDRVSLSSLEESVTVRPGSCAVDAPEEGVPVDSDVVLGDGVELESVWVTSETDPERVDASVTTEQSVSPPGAFPSESAVFALDTDDPVETVTVTFAVDREELDAAGLEPEDLAVYSDADGDWSALDTTVVEPTDDGSGTDGDGDDGDDDGAGDDGDTVYLRAEADADARIGLGATAPIVTDVVVENAVAGEPMDVRIEFENAGQDADEVALPVLLDGERIGDATTSVPAAGSTETVLTTTVDEPGEVTVQVGNVERTVSVAEARTELSIVDLYVEDDRLEPGGSTEIVAVVENSGNAPGEYRATFTIDGRTADVKTVTVGPDEPARITFTQSFQDPGTYEVGVDGETRTVTVGDVEGSDGEGGSDGDDGGAAPGPGQSGSLGIGVPEYAAVTTALVLLLSGGIAFGVQSRRKGI